MKFYDIDSVFISGKYAGETLAEVYEKILSILIIVKKMTMISIFHRK